MKIEEVIRTVNQMKADGIITNYAVGGAVEDVVEDARALGAHARDAEPFAERPAELERARRRVVDASGQTRRYP